LISGDTLLRDFYFRDKSTSSLCLAPRLEMGTP
jgi:hypothetical protein